MGGLMVLGAAVGFGLSPMLAQLLLQQGFTPEVIALFRFAIPLLIMLPFLRRLNLSDAESLRTIAIGALMGCGMLIHLYSYDWLPAALVIQIYYTYPLFAMGLGWALFRQPATQNRLIAAGLIVIAVSIMLDPSDLGEQPLWVLPLSFMAPVSYALLLNYFAKPVRAMPSSQRMGACAVGHLLVLIPIILWQAQMQIAIDTPMQILPTSSEQTTLIIALGLLAATLPQYLFARGSLSTGIERLTTIGSLEIIFALFFGVVFLNNEIGRLDIIAAGLIVMAGLIRLETRQISPVAPAISESEVSH
ncbi:DMT family transporter [Amphritea balenae]|uniref:EamA/RhaT family transporter n=1 Tax=Amphritea balenae TaxID=452629 RepID=A0A3P1SQA6_9GAMM|nr:DMT family transporter [Amphritea balenae]RRC99317.1 EamA/RhaT family transporter [Amphritea balenae]GGK72084.1 membrane protein [Amphritea balenae]